MDRKVCPAFWECAETGGHGNAARPRRGREVRDLDARIPLAACLSVEPVTSGGQVQGVEHQTGDTKPGASVITGCPELNGPSKADLAVSDVDNDDREAAGALPDEAMAATEE